MALTALLGTPSVGCTGDCEVEDPGALVEVGDAQNYSFSGELDVSSVTIAEQIPTCADGEDNDGDEEIDESDECRDIAVDWSGLTVDLQGHEVDPVADIDSVTLLLFRYHTQEEVEQGLSDNTLDQSALSMYAGTTTGAATSLNISDLTLLGNDFDVEQYLLAENGTFLLTLATGETPGVGTRTAVFLAPDASSDNVAVDIGDGSVALDFEVDLSSAAAAVVPEGVDYELDWSGLQTNGIGGEFVPGDADSVLVARYDQLGLADLEADFLDVELLADGLWSADIDGATAVAMSDLSGDTVFDGVDTDGTWLFGLRCSTCANPAPLFLTQLQPLSEACE